MWHRVDYDGYDDNGRGADKALDKLSIGASIFHFYPTLFITKNFPLFSFLIIPNLLKELFGVNIE